MKQLSDLLCRMQQALCQLLPTTPGCTQLSVSCGGDTPPELLSWLATQPVYPQFYWQHRQDTEEVAVCGILRGFRHINDAESFLQHPLCPVDLRIWGLNAFEHADDAPSRSASVSHSYLFLPRVELSRQGNQLSLRVNLFSETSLRQDAEEAAAFIKFLLPAQPIPPLNTSIADQHHQPTQEGWRAMIHQALQRIRAGEMEKVVLARCTTLALSKPILATSMMSASRAANHHCFHFMLAHDAQQAFMGSSPERLYFRQGQSLSTEALAGTVANDEDERQAVALGQWLMNDSKNQYENRLVVDDICQRLQQGALALEVQSPEIVRLRKVQHLRRAIQATLRHVSDAQCLDDLQPTAAVAGLPRQAARQFIRDVEPFERGWYAGSAGYLSRQQAEFCVALRSAEIQGDSVKLYAGAGILPGSDPEQEWQELENKAAGLKTLLSREAS